MPPQLIDKRKGKPNCASAAAYTERDICRSAELVKVLNKISRVQCTLPRNSDQASDTPISFAVIELFCVIVCPL